MRRLLEKSDFLSECLGTRLEHYSKITYGMGNPLHVGYTFTNTEGLVNDLLQDYSVYIYREGCRVPHNSIGE